MSNGKKKALDTAMTRIAELERERDAERHRADSYAAEIRLTVQRFAELAAPDDAAGVAPPATVDS